MFSTTCSCSCSFICTVNILVCIQQNYLQVHICVSCRSQFHKQVYFVIIIEFEVNMENQELACLMVVVFAIGVLSGSYFGNGILFGSCIDCENQALLLLNGSLPDNWNHISSWIGNHCCAWHGINYNNETGQVIHLDIQNGYLRGDQKHPFLLDL